MSDFFTPTIYENYGTDPKFWMAAKSLSEVSKRTAIPETQLLELCERKLIPHYKINGGPPRFHLPSLNRWIASNLVEVVPGKSLPLVKVTSLVVNDPKANPLKVPACLSGVSGLFEVTMATLCSGVYFLCRGDICVYVGQAKCLRSRIGNHTDKDWDRAYYIPISEENLTEIEQAFISQLLPEYNKCVFAQKCKKEKTQENQ